MSGRLTGHDFQTNDALAEPAARGRRRHAEHRLCLNGVRATRRNPSGAGQGGAADELASAATAAPPSKPAATCVAARRACAGDAARAGQTACCGTSQGSPCAGSGSGSGAGSGPGAGGSRYCTTAGGRSTAIPGRGAGSPAASTAIAKRGCQQLAITGAGSDADAGSDSDDALRGGVRRVLTRR
jgi:hypothetical protein